MPDRTANAPDRRLPLALADLFTGFAWDILHVWDLNMGNSLFRILPGLVPAFIFARAARECDYHFEAYGGDNPLFLRDLGFQ